MDTMTRQSDVVAPINEVRRLQERRRSPIASVLAAISGAAIVIGSLLEWVQGPSSVVAFQGGTVEGSPAGTASIYGWIALAGGVVVLVAALLWLARGRRRSLAVAGLLGGLVSAGVAIFYLATLQSRYIDFAVDQAASRQLPAAKIEDLLTRALSADLYSIAPGIGLYVTMAGGTAAVVLALVGLRRKRADAARRDLPASPAERV
jgi:hypothetical protein